MNLRNCVYAVLLTACLALVGKSDQLEDLETVTIHLSGKHMEAVNRRRRIIYHHDAAASTNHPLYKVGPEKIDTVVQYLVSALDATGNQIDSIWFDWSEGNYAVWKSKILPPQAFGAYPGWWKAGHDIVQLTADAARERGREVFFTYRINGGDHDFGVRIPPIKQEHPEWTHDPYFGLGYEKHHIFWNFAFPEVRDYKLKVIREIAENYDFDGISVDFARGPHSFLAGTQWLHRNHLTNFMRQVRQTILEVEKQRGRALVLAVRVPENIVGCHFDGIDIQTWANEKLADIFVLGIRSSEVDFPAFHRITAGTGIKLYPCFDYVHTSDSYDYTPIEYSRGVYTNWWQQGADGAYTFNCYQLDPVPSQSLGGPKHHGWELQCQLFREIGSPQLMKYKDKVFFVQRRGYSGATVPKAEDWWTPRHQYTNTNMFGTLPATIPNSSRADRLLSLWVADDVHAARDKIKRITLHVALLDPHAEDLPEADRHEGIAGVRRGKAPQPPKLYIAKGTEKLVEARVNNLLLDGAKLKAGWLVFPVEPEHLALGENLVGVRITANRSKSTEPIRIEKLELHLDYH